MEFTLNGWRRLWLVLCATYLLAVVGMSWTMWPELRTSKSDVHYLSAADKKAMIIPDADGWTELVSGATDVKLPNGEQIAFRPGVSDVTIRQVSRDYWRVVEARVQAERLQVLGVVGAIWLVPCIALYAAGAAVAWVLAGFRAK